MRSIKKVRISIGASSTTNLAGSTGPPLATLRSSAAPATFHTSLFFSMSALSWLADKLNSVTLLIWKRQEKHKQETTLLILRIKVFYKKESIQTTCLLILPSCLETAFSILHLLPQSCLCLLQSLHAANANKKTS